MQAFLAQESTIQRKTKSLRKDREEHPSHLIERMSQGHLWFGGVV